MLTISEQNMSKPRYLVISPSWLGDLIMAQSLFMEIKRQEPNCILDIYAPEYTMPILDRMPELDAKIVNPFAHGAFNLKQRYQEGKKLRLNHYDKVFVLPNSLKSALIAFFAKIPQRIGFKGESRYFILNKLRTNKQDFPLIEDNSSRKVGQIFRRFSHQARRAKFSPEQMNTCHRDFQALEKHLP